MSSKKSKLLSVFDKSDRSMSSKSLIRMMKQTTDVLFPPKTVKKKKKGKEVINVDSEEFEERVEDFEHPGLEEIDSEEFDGKAKVDPRLSVSSDTSYLTNLENIEDHMSSLSLNYDVGCFDADILPEAFVPLTREEKNAVSTAFSPENRRRVLATHRNSNVEITGEILQCLRPTAWLNDEVINVYMDLLKEREIRDPEKFLKCHFFNTFFYKKMTSGANGYDFKSVRRWTTPRKLGYNLVDCDKIFIPVHKEVHWCLAVINKKEEKFQYLDSLGGTDFEVFGNLARYFVDEVRDKSGKDIDVRSWLQEYVKDLPQQQDRSDCGMFMIKYADFYSRGGGLYFDQGDMKYFRLRTAKEILRLKAD